MEVNLNDGDYDGRTALHLAAVGGHLKVVRFLIEKCNVKIDPKVRNKGGRELEWSNKLVPFAV